MKVWGFKRTCGSSGRLFEHELKTGHILINTCKNSNVLLNDTPCSFCIFSALTITVLISVVSMDHVCFVVYAGWSTHCTDSIHLYTIDTMSMLNMTWPHRQICLILVLKLSDWRLEILAHIVFIFLSKQETTCSFYECNYDRVTEVKINKTWSDVKSERRDSVWIRFLRHEVNFHRLIAKNCHN